MKKGVFQIISVFFLMLAVISLLSLLFTLQTNNRRTLSEFVFVSHINEHATNMGYLVGSAYNVSGRSINASAGFIEITENDSLLSDLEYNLDAISKLANFTNSSLTINDNKKIIFASSFVYFSVPNTTLGINSTYHYITAKASCSNLSSMWNSTAGNSRNISLSVVCTSSPTTLTLNQQVSSGVLNVTDDGTVILSITVNDTIQVLKFRNTYLNIITKMNHSIIPHLDGSFVVTKGSAAKNGLVWLDGYVG